MQNQNTPTPPKQRLAIFLDGTWNTQDDSTNILNAHALTFEGKTDDGFIQKRYYDRGVGTGVFDSVLGGGFGIGLEVNVREAYNWLVDHYNVGDQIYIFGFSRGAYSARSLVGFISTCGLIKRGAPLTNSQLWDGYVKLSRARGGEKNLLGKITSTIKPPFRRLKKIPKNGGANVTEKLLKEWSHEEVKITYLGIFDTVGAMGIEALGIQGLRSRSGLNHNQYPTKKISKCRHALAIDENRSSFRLTPFLHYIPNPDEKKEVEKKGYHNIISQKWFIGAHSNIGGGYNDNLLAYFPLKWILDGAKQATPDGKGLQMRDLDASSLSAEISQVNDSYKDFSGMIWPHIIREKRHYRAINQSDIVFAGIYGKRDMKTGKSKMEEVGFALSPINEEIDQSVLDLIEAANDENYVPPNLKNYANRIVVEGNSDERNREKEKINKKIKALFADRISNEKWLGESPVARIILVFWSTLAAIGITFFIVGLLIKIPFFNWESIALIALVFTIADYSEFHLNLKTALYPSDIISKVTLNVLLWIRLAGVVLFFLGTLAFTFQCINWGCSSEMTMGRIIDLVQEKKWYLIPFFPMIAVLVLDLWCNGLEKKGDVINLKAVFKNIGATILSPIVFLSFGFIITFFSGFLTGFSSGAITEAITEVVFQELTSTEQAGLFLIVVFLLLILNYIIIWVGKPTRRARLDFAILGLQSAYTPSKVKELFDVMRYNISQLWVADTKEERKSIAWGNAKEIVRESLWRDILGFIPVYTFIFGTILWLASTYGQHENWTWLRDTKTIEIPIWIWIIFITAIADCFENTIHLRHVKNYLLGGSSFFLVAIGTIFTIIKFIGFFSALILSVAIFVNLSYDVLIDEPGGWRWFIAVFITLFNVFIPLRLLIKFVRNKFPKK